ncbi:MAG: hypothetical protein MJ252_27360 [archaeon]|nr:hypothetical protein [archaeon]
MENSDSVDFSTYTIGEQVTHVTSVTTGSHVTEYGDQSPKTETLAKYQGDADEFIVKLVKFLKDAFEGQKKVIEKTNVIQNENMLLSYLRDTAERSKDIKDWEAYQEELIMAERSKNIFAKFVEKLNVPEQKVGKVDFDCYRRVMSIYEEKCGVNVDRDHKYFTHFYNYCSMRKGYWPAYHALNEICAF